MKLNSKLLMNYLISGVILLIIIGYYAGIHLKKERFQTIQEVFISQLYQLDFAISDFLEQVEYDVENLVSNERVRTQHDADFTNFLEAEEHTFQYNIGTTEQEIIDLFSNYRDTHPYVNSVYMGRENGGFVRSHKRNRPTRYDPRQRPWYRLAVSHPGKVMRTVPYKSVTTDDVNIGTVKALVDKEGRLFGVVGIDVTLRNLTEYISDIKVGGNGHIFLLDNNGIVLVNRDKTTLFQTYHEAGMDYLQDSMNNTSGYISFSSKKEEQYLFYYTSPRLKWKICAVVHKDEIERETRQFVYKITWILTGALFLLSVLTTVGVRKFIVNPIKTLQRSTERIIRTGELNHNVKIASHDEIGQLSDSFNEMILKVKTREMALRQAHDELEQRVAERTSELAKANELLYTVINNLPDYIYVKDNKSRFLLANDASVRSLKLTTLDELIGKTDFDLFPPELAERFYADERKVVESGQSLIDQEETIIDRTTDSILWFLTTKVPLRDAQGNVVGLVGLSRNITERKHAEEELRKLSRAVEQSANAIIITDLTGTIEFVNPAFPRTTGYSSEEVIGENPRILKSGKMASDVYEELWDTISRGEVWQGELINKKKNGELYWQFATISPIKDQEGKTTHYLAVNEDITNLKNAQSQLIQAEKLAALGQLVAGIAHEINTPLGAIKASISNISLSFDQVTEHLPGLLQLIASNKEQQHLFMTLLNKAKSSLTDLSSKEKRTLKRHIRNILSEEQVEDASALTDILIYMKIEDVDDLISLFKNEDTLFVAKAARNFVSLGKNSHTIAIAVEKAANVVFALKKFSHQAPTDEKIETDIIDSIETVLTLYYNQLKQGVEVIRIFRPLPLVWCHPDELGQVWTNFIHNALQAMELKGTLTIETAHVDNHHIMVSFSDTGCGIPDDIKDRIFEPFFTTKKRGEGSGLGLGIVKGIVEKHQGRIEVESEIGKGTTFRVLLPINQGG